MSLFNYLSIYFFLSCFHRITAETMSVHLNVNKARDTFKELTQKDWITNMVVFFRLLFGKRKYTETFFLRTQNFRRSICFERFFETLQHIQMKSNSDSLQEFASIEQNGGIVVVYVTDSLNGSSVHTRTHTCTLSQREDFRLRALGR